MRNQLRNIKIGVICLGLFTSIFAYAQEVKITSTIDLREVPLGKFANLQITLEGANNASEIDVPTIDGLNITRSGTSRNTQIINGQFSSFVTYNYTVLPMREGSFTIPPIRVEVGDEAYFTEEFTIRVLPQGSTQTPSNQNQTLEAQLSELIFMEVEPSKNTLYLGEKMPLTIRLLISDQVRIQPVNEPPVIDSSKILMSPLNLEEFRQTRQTRNNRSYEVFSWQIDITAIEAGDTDLQTQLNMSVLVRRQRSNPGSLFDSDFFGSRMQAIPIVARSGSAPLNILALPDDSNFPGFTGAIGDFQITSQAQPQEIKLGDPITLDITISGQGNFDRVFHEGLEENDAWRVYEPERIIENNPSNGASMSITFKQAIIAQDTTISGIPEIPFTFFNPDLGAYQEVVAAPIPLNIQENAGTRPGAFSNNSSSIQGSGNLLNLESAGSRLAEIALTQGKVYNSLIAFPLKPTFQIAVASLMALSLALVILQPILLPILRRDDAAQREWEKQREALEKEMNQAVRGTDKVAYLKAARNYSRHILGAAWNIAPQAITTAEIKQRLQPSSKYIYEVFTLADTLQYAGSASIQIEPNEFSGKLKSELKAVQETGS